MTTEQENNAQEPLEQEAELETNPSEELARERGWKSRDEWKGSVPDNFIDDPDQFNEVFEKSNPKLKDEVEQLRSELETMRSFRADWEAHKQKELARELDALKEQLASAASKGDVESVNRLVEQRDELQKQEAPQSPEVAEFEGWKAENTWYVPGSEDFDPDKVAYAEAIGQHIAARNPNLRGRAFLDQVKAEVDKRFQTESPTPQPSPVEGARRVARTGGKRKVASFADMPAEKQNSRDVQRIINKMYGGDADAYARDWAAMNS